MEVSREEPNAMLHQPTGKYVVPIMHHEARKNKKREQSLQEVPSAQEERAAPSELVCAICMSLVRDAVLALCCGDSFCAECIEQKVLEDPEQVCPGSGCMNVGVN